MLAQTLACFLAVSCGATPQEQDGAEALIARLEVEPNPDEQIVLLFQIAESGHFPSIIPRLTAFVDSEDVTVRAHAAAAICGVGAERVLVEKFLEANDWEMRAAVKGLLVRRKDERFLMSRLLHDQSAEVRLEVGVAAVCSGASVKELDKLLRDTSEHVRAEVAVACLEEGAKTPQALTWLLNDTSPEVRQLVGAAIAKAGHPEMVKSLLSDPAVDVRVGVALAMLEAETGRDPAIIAVVALDGDQDTACSLCFSLSNSDRERVGELLVGALVAPAYRDRVLLCIASMLRTPKVADQELVRLAKKDTSKTVAVLLLLAKLNSHTEDTLTFVQTSLGDSRSEVRRAAVRLVADGNLIQFLPQLKAAMANDTVSAVRVEAARAVCILDSEDLRCVSVLSQALDDGNAGDVCECLRACGPRSVVASSSILRLLKNKQTLVSSASAVLEAMGPTSHRVLATWLEDEGLSATTKLRLLELRGDSFDKRPHLLRILELTQENPQSVCACLRLLSSSGPVPVAAVRPLASSPAVGIRIWCCSVLGNCVPSEMTSSIGILRTLTGDPHLSVRLAAGQRLLQLGSHTELVQSIATDSLGRISTMSMQQRASLLKLCKGSGLAGPDLVATLLNAHSEGTDFPIDVLTLVLRAAGEGAVTKLIAGLSAPEASKRGFCCRALGAIGTRAALPALIESLQDSGQYTGYNVRQVRHDALEAIAAIGTDGTILPRIVPLLKDDQSRPIVAGILEDLGPSAKAVLPELMRLPPSLEVARAIASIEVSELGLAGFRMLIASIPRGDSWLEPVALDTGALADSVVALGKRSTALVDDLSQLAEKTSILHPSSRVQAAYCLACIDKANRQKWIRFLRLHSGARSRLANRTSQLARERLTLLSKAN